MESKIQSLESLNKALQVQQEDYETMVKGLEGEKDKLILDYHEAKESFNDLRTRIAQHLSQIDNEIISYKQKLKGQGDKIQGEREITNLYKIFADIQKVTNRLNNENENFKLRKTVVEGLMRQEIK